VVEDLTQDLGVRLRFDDGVLAFRGANEEVGDVGRRRGQQPVGLRQGNEPLAVHGGGLFQHDVALVEVHLTALDQDVADAGQGQRPAAQDRPLVVDVVDDRGPVVAQRI
jgi:hypothetical protein